MKFLIVTEKEIDLCFEMAKTQIGLADREVFIAFCKGLRRKCRENGQEINFKEEKR